MKTCSGGYFRRNFDLPGKAVACFLEHRRVQPSEEEREQVYGEAARDRRVLGVLPLDNDGMAKPPARGRVWATLPTEVTLPFGLHINADWLLNISRTGLREIEDNPWQRGIADSIADILTGFLEWSADTRAVPDRAKAAFKALALPSPEAGGLEALLAEEHWLSGLRNRLEDAAVFPVWTGETGTLAFAKPGDTVVPPAPLARAFSKYPDLRPAVLLKGSVLMGDVLGPDALKLLRRIGLLCEMSPQELEQAWQGGLEDWWKQFPGEHESRRRLLFGLWAAVADLLSDEALAGCRSSLHSFRRRQMAPGDRGRIPQREASYQKGAGRIRNPRIRGAARPGREPPGGRMGCHPSPTETQRA